jgi:DNA-binding transcriptional LysR family regulator
MHTQARRGDAFVSLPSGVDWEDIRLFLLAAEHQSFRQAAESAAIHPRTLTRRIETLELALDRRLFDRTVDGLSLTAAGKDFLAGAKAMEQGFYEAVRAKSSHRGVVTVSVTEGLGVYWVMPRLASLTDQNPNLIVDLQLGMATADVLRLEANAAISLARPTNPDLMVVKLGRLHVHAFASHTYVGRFGLPKSIDDMKNHRIVLQTAPEVDPDAWKAVLRVPTLEGIVGMRTNSSAGVFYAVERGAGIGVLPTYSLAFGAPLVPVELGEARRNFDIWLSFHRDARKTKTTAFVLDWLEAIFDPKRFPWFRDEFIHPTELIGMAPDEEDENSIQGFFTGDPTRSEFQA